MQDSSTALTTVLQFRQDIQARLRDRVRQAIEETLDEELAATLGSTRHERTAGRHSGLNARAAYDTFVKKWTTLCPPVARSLEEAGLDLLTFYALCGSRCARRTRWRISIANSGAAPRPKRRSVRRRPPSPCSSVSSRLGTSCCERLTGIRISRRSWRRNGLRRREEVEWSTVQQDRCASALFLQTSGRIHQTVPKPSPNGRTRALTGFGVGVKLL